MNLRVIIFLETVTYFELLYCQAENLKLIQMFFFLMQVAVMADSHAYDEALKQAANVKGMLALLPPSWFDCV